MVEEPYLQLNYSKAALLKYSTRNPETVSMIVLVAKFLVDLTRDVHSVSSARLLAT